MIYSYPPFTQDLDIFWLIFLAFFLLSFCVVYCYWTDNSHLNVDDYPRFCTWFFVHVTFLIIMYFFLSTELKSTAEEETEACLVWILSPKTVANEDSVICK